MGALVRAVAPDAHLTVLAGPEQDLHMLQAKPTMIRSLRSADLLVAVGAELEVGWLPAASSSAANPQILPGREGYFEAAAQVPLLDVGGAADRARGDVHPAGNPHVDLDPVRMAQIAETLGGRMALLDPTNAATYRRNAARFADAVERRMPDWQSQLADAPGVVLYHRDAVYLLDRFGVPLLGTIEPVPGVPPSGRDLRNLAGKLQGRDGIIIHAPYQAPKGPRKLGRELGWPVRTLPLEPPASADGDGYLRHIDRWVRAIGAA
jgi:zinc/manganese transport system substrate-binding protein